QMWRIDRAATENHSFLGARLLHISVTGIANTDDAILVKEQSAGVSLGSHGEIGPVQRGFEVGCGSTMAFAAPLRDLVEANAQLLRPIKVWVERQTDLDGGFNKGAGHGVDRPKVSDVEGTAGAVVLGSAALLVLSLFEVRQHARVVPAFV